VAPWRLIDLSEFDAAGQQERLTRILETDRLERFDLAAPPLMRFALIKLAAERHRLLISNHHLLMDGWSAPILVRELLEIYGRAAARLGCRASPLPRLSGVDCPAGPCRGAVGVAGEPGRSRGGHAACGAADAGGSGGPQPAARQAVAPERIELSLGGALSADLNRMARELALTLNTVLQTAWGILLGRLTGRSDVVFGVTVAGRPAELAGVEQMVGLFINTLPLRMALPPQLPLSELLRQTQERQSRLMAHQHLGLAEIQQAAGLGELFDTLMVFENYPVDRAGLAAAGRGLQLGRVEGRDATHYPLAVIVRPGETLHLRLDYRPDLFDAASVAALGGRLIRLLAAAVADPARALGALPILEPAERDTILRRWNDTGHVLTHAPALAAAADGGGDGAPIPAPVPATLPALFAAQAARTPDAAAVLFEDRVLSYAELDAHANRLAHHLQSRGVGPDVLVGVLAERSLELVVGLLGILKAGGAYLPLDPDYPRERLTGMVSDAGLGWCCSRVRLRHCCRCRRGLRHPA
jgi:hypothetical protein